MWQHCHFNFIYCVKYNCPSLHVMEGRASLSSGFLETAQLWCLYDFDDFMAACFDYFKLVISWEKGRGNRKENIQFMQCLVCLLSAIYGTFPIVIMRPQMWRFLCDEVCECCQCRLICTPGPRPFSNVSLVFRFLSSFLVTGYRHNWQAKCEWKSPSKTFAEPQVKAVTVSVVTFFANILLFLWFADRMLHHLPLLVVFYKTSQNRVVIVSVT